MSTYSAQSVSISGGNVFENGQICLDISIEGFQDLIGMEFELKWDSTVLEYSNLSIKTNLENFTDGSISDPTETAESVGSNILIVGWFDNDLVPRTLPDDEVLFEVCFDAIGTVGSSSTMNLQNLLFTDSNVNPVDFDDNDNIVSITNAAGNSLTFDFPTVNADSGEIVCMPLTVLNFDSISNFSFGVKWDATVLSYQNLNVGTTLINFNGSNIRTIGADSIHVSWSDNDMTGESLAVGYRLFEICFKVVGAPARSSLLRFGSVSADKPSGAVTSLNANNGLIIVSSPPIADDLRLSSNDVTVNPGQVFCLPVKVNGFVDLTALEFGITWDNSVVSFQNIMNLSSLPGFDATDVSASGPGLSFDWESPDAEGKTLNNGTTLFDVCFNTIGVAGTNSAFDFNSMIATNMDGLEVTEIKKDGSIIVETPSADDVIFSLNTITLANGESGCLTLKVQDFVSLDGFSFDISWNPQNLIFQNANVLASGLTGFDDADITAPNEAGGTDGSVLVGWNDANNVGRNLADGTGLFEICFEANGFDKTRDFSFSNINVSNTTGLAVNAQGVNGQIVIEPDGSQAPVIFIADDLSIDEGGSGCFPIKVSGFTNLVAAELQIDWDNDIFAFTQFQNLASLSFFSTSSISNPQAGRAIVSWDDNDGTGKTLTDNTVLFEICGTGASVGVSTAVISNQIAADANSTKTTSVDNGTITVSSSSGSADLSVFAEDYNINTGEQICVPVKVNGFTDLITAELRLEWNPNVLNFDKIQNLANLESFSETSSFSFPPANMTDNTVILTWLHDPLTGQTLPNNSTLFEACFTGIAPGTATLDFTEHIFADNSQSQVQSTASNGSITVAGQPSGLTLSAGTTTVAPAGNGCVPITVRDFENLVIMEFKLEWDPSVAEFDRIENVVALPYFSGTSSLSFPPANMTDDLLIVTWLDDDLTGKSLADDTELFSVCFNAVGDPNEETNLTFSDQVFADVSQQTVPSSVVSGKFIISDNSNNNFSLAVNPQNMANMNEDVCIPIRASGFSEITEVTFDLNWDAAVFGYSGIMNIANVAGLDLADFTIPGSGGSPGALNLTWIDDDNSGESLVDNSILFELCLEAIGNEGESSNVEIANLDVEDANGASFNLTSTNGVATINESVTVGPFKLLAEDKNGGQGTQQCVKISTENFTAISSMNFVVEWDKSIVTYLSTNVLTNLIDFNDDSILDPLEMTSLDNSLIVDWDHPSGGAESLPNPTDLFEICFELTGVEGAVSALDIKNIVVTNSAGSNVSALKEDGSLRIDLDNDSGLVQIAAPSIEGNRGDELCIDLTVKNFVEILSTEFILSWNNDIITYSSHTIVANLPFLTEGVISTPNEIPSRDDIFAVAWFDEDGNTHTLNDGDVFINICFDLIGGEGSGTALNFTETVFSRDGNPLGHFLVDGFISIISTINGEIDFKLSEESVAPGGEACVDVEVENFNEIDMIDLSFGWDDQILNYSKVNITSAIPGLDDSNFTNTSSTKLDLSWVNPTPDGITLSDNSVLFELCYNAIGSAGSTSLVFITNGQVLNKAGDNLNIVSENGRVRISDILAINSVEIDSVSCNGLFDGSIEVSVTGGNSNYTYTWNPAVSTGPRVENLDAGTYDLTVTDGNTTIMESFNVFEPAALMVDPVLTGVTPPATDGIIDLNISGGTRPYSIDWCCSLMNDVEIQRNLAQGTYMATITDANNCEITTSEIELNGGLFVSGAIVNELDCSYSEDGILELMINGGQSPYNIEWSDGTNVIGEDPRLSGVSAGMYSYTVTDSNGIPLTRTGTITLSAPAPLMVDVQINPETNTGSDGSLIPTPSGGVGGYIFSWFSYSNSSSSTNQNQVNLQSGYYRLDLLDANFCRLTVDSIFVGGAINVPVEGIQVDSISCFGECDGKITISPEGGTGDYLYSFSGMSSTSSNMIDGLCAGTTTIIVTDVNNGDRTVVQVTLNNPDPITISPSIIGVSMGNDGGILLDIEGGTAPYEYLWSSGERTRDIRGLSTGRYSVTVTDNNGCTSELDDIEVNVRSLTIDILNVEDVVCSGDLSGAIAVNVSGGCIDYNYFWRKDGLLISTDRNISNILDGLYELQVIDNCMETLFSGEIRVAALSNLEIQGELISDYNGFGVSGFGRNDGSARVVITGGRESYIIEWSTGATEEFISDLESGTYTVTVEDQLGCRKVSSVVINEPAALEIDFEILGINDCSNETKGVAQINVFGGVPSYSYNWENGMNGPLATNLASGYTKVTVTDANNVSVVDSVFINFQTQFDIDTIIRPDLGNKEGAITLVVNGGTGSYSYQWDDPNNSSTSTISGLLAGVYNVVVTDDSGCAVLLRIVVPFSGESPECLEAREVFTPNNDGRNDFFVVNCISNFVNDIQIFNRFGDVVFEQDNYDNLWDGRDSSGDLLPQGAYFYVLNFINANGGKELRKGHISIIR